MSQAVSTARGPIGDHPTELFIGGAWVPGEHRYDAIDPSSGKVFTDIALAGANDVDLAVRAARAAAPGWARTSPTERAALLLRWAALIERDAERIAALEALDVGKPIADARRNLAGAIGGIRYVASAADKLWGVTLPSRDRDHLGFTTVEPRGVCAMIMAWNVPTIFAGGAVAPALATGNAVVYKPSEVAPLAPLAMLALLDEAGAPAGIVNVIVGGAEAGQALAGHRGIDHLSFVGSTATGIDVLGRAARNITPVKVELGGKSASVVYPDADVPAAAAALARAIADNAGQNCNAMSRAIVHASVAAEFLECAHATLAAVRIGPWDEAADMGPVVNARQQDRILGMVAAARGEGARVVAGGALPDDLAGSGGFYVAPTLLDQVTREMTVANEEVFGPVLSVLQFDDDAEAIELANATEYGLAASVWTNDLSRAHRAVAELDAGQVFVNELAGYSIIGLPFEARRNSGYHKALGYRGLHEYVREKSVSIRLG